MINYDFCTFCWIGKVFNKEYLFSNIIHTSLYLYSTRKLVRAKRSYIVNLPRALLDLCHGRLTAPELVHLRRKLFFCVDINENV